MVYTMLKSTYEKIPAKEISYRCYKNFSLEKFNKELTISLKTSKPRTYIHFQNTFERVLQLHAPIKKKTIRGNNKPHVSKKLRKEIMKRSYLKSIANKTNDPEDVLNYKRQRNLVTKLNKIEKKLYFQKVDTNLRMTIWQKCEPYLSSKQKAFKKIILVENDIVISDDKKIANIFNTYFSNITKSLIIPRWQMPAQVQSNQNDPISNAIWKYRTHPSIKQIKSVFGEKHSFSSSRFFYIYQ